MILALTAIALMAGCSKDDEQQSEPIKVTDQSYIGTIKVDQSGTSFTAPNITTQIVKVDDKTINIKMLKVKFAEAMPVTLDMTIAGVSYTASSSKITLSGNNIVPTALGGSFEAYKITGLNGTIQNKTLSLSMTCGVFPLSYAGKLVE